MNPLENFFYEHSHRLMQKDAHYFAIYHRHFEKFCNRRPIVWEFGVSHGGSLQMWKYYFGAGAEIYGIDINPECKLLEEPQVKIVIGSQDDPVFLNNLVQILPQPDIIIDDGGHRMLQQKLSFKILFPYLKEGGIYLCEDTGTSYWPSFYGGYRRGSSFIEMCKTLVDTLHLPMIPKNFSNGRKNLYMHLYSLHFYESIVVMEKEKKEKTKNYIIGEPTLQKHFKYDKNYRYNLMNIWYRFRKYLKK